MSQARIRMFSYKYNGIIQNQSMPVNYFLVLRSEAFLRRVVSAIFPPADNIFSPLHRRGFSLLAPHEIDVCRYLVRGHSRESGNPSLAPCTARGFSSSPRLAKLVPKGAGIHARYASPDTNLIDGNCGFG